MLSFTRAETGYFIYNTRKNRGTTSVIPRYKVSRSSLPHQLIIFLRNEGYTSRMHLQCRDVEELLDFDDFVLSFVCIDTIFSPDAELL